MQPIVIRAPTPRKLHALIKKRHRFQLEIRRCTPCRSFSLLLRSCVAHLENGARSLLRVAFSELGTPFKVFVLQSFPVSIVFPISQSVFPVSSICFQIVKGLCLLSVVYFLLSIVYFLSSNLKVRIVTPHCIL
jgi:hypothetical protein